MTKKYLIQFADHLKRELDGERGLRMCQIEYVADFLQRVNPSFNRARWIGYIKGECGPNGGVIRR